MNGTRKTAPLQVYLVDNDRDHLRLIQQALAAQDDTFRFRTFASPKEALEALETSAPDAVVSDYLFGPDECTGLEFFEKMLAAGCKAPFIFLTGEGSEEVAAEAFRRGAADYFTKDVGFAHFFRITQSIQRAVAHRQVELEKDHLEERYSAMEFVCHRLMDEAPDLILLLDERGNILSVNRRVVSETGYSDEEMLGRPLSDFVSEVNHEEVKRNTALLLEGGPPIRMKASYLNRKGEPRQIEVTGVGVAALPGEGRWILAIGRDVTEASRQVAELIWSKDLLDRVINSLEEVVHVIDPDLRVLFCNRNIEMLSRGKVSDREMRGRHLAEVFPFLAERGVIEEYRRVFSTGEPLVTRECVRYENEEITTSTRKIPLLDAGGKVEKVITIMKDVTREARAEAELARKNEELERLNQELNSFISMTSHELRSPLTNIEGFSHLLKDKLDTLSKEDIRDFVSRISGNATRLHQLIDDLLLFSRERKRPAEHVEVELKRLIDEVIGQLGALVEAGRAEVSVDLEVPTAWADRQKLFQILKNLVENALTYRREGVSPQVAIVVRSRGDHLQFTVRDNGPGIQEGEREQIFEIFRRGSTSRGKPGTGVGLALVKENVQRMGGALRLESSGPDGSVFLFTLPARP